MSELPTTLTFRVEHTEYADIEVNVPGLIAEWREVNDAPIEDRDDVIDVLNQIGGRDLMYSGDFIRVLDRDSEESIQ